MRTPKIDFTAPIDVTALEREAQRLRAEALAEFLHRLFRAVARRLHVGGTPAHG